jgi:ATP-dependent exoDNAse (exonuclease V) beta subunit
MNNSNNQPEAQPDTQKSVIPDSAERLRALDPTESFAVSAPAGSGKTELLTQRVLKLLSRVEKPEQILCLTFTRKAAGEMLQRVSSALRAAQSDSEPAQPHARQTWQLAKDALARDAEQGWQLLQSPNRLKIQTIDGFCRSLAQQLSLESGFSTTTEPLEQPFPHYQQATSELLMTHLNKDDALGEAIGCLLQHLDNDLNRLEGLLIGLIEKREQWLSHLISTRDARPYLEQFLRETINETLATLASQLQPIASDLCIQADYAATNLQARKVESPICACAGLTGLPAAEPEHMPVWLGLIELLITKDERNPGWRSDRGINIKIGFPTAKDDPKFGDSRKSEFKSLLGWCREQHGLLESLLDVRYLPHSTYPEGQWQTLEALSRLLPALAAQLQWHFQQNNCCDFTEVTLAAQRALGYQDNPTELALKLDYQLQHILIDEFQDTSSIQFEILRLLIQGWQQGDGRTLFIVGDGMQSLYGFRNANVGLFLETRTQPVGDIRLTPLDLSVNFRSQKGIMQWINAVFDKAFPSRDNIARGAVRYAPSHAFHPALDTPAVTIDGFYGYEDYSEEARQVTTLVKAAREQNPLGTIAILVRNRSHLRQILPALQEAKLRWQAADIDPLASRMPVIDLMSLTRALLSPTDRIAWLSILRAPWCGLDLHDLYHLANTPVDESPALADGYPLLLSQISHYRQIKNISADGQQILERVSNILLTAWQQRQRQSLRCWIEDTWHALGGPQCLLDPVEAGYCEQYLDLLEANTTIDDWDVFEQAVERLYAAPDPAAGYQLQIMTIHKAKGLEFDTVIIPGLGRSGGSDQQQLLLWRERLDLKGNTQLLISPPKAKGQEQDLLYRHLQYEAKEKNLLENTRVIYVGATRAIRNLHLLYSIKSDNHEKPANNSLLARIWPWLGPIVSDAELEATVEQDGALIRLHRNPNAQDDSADESVHPGFTTISRLPPNWQPSESQSIVFAGVDAVANSGGNRAEANDATARHTGTVLHRILRQITLEGAQQWTQQTIRQRGPYWEAQLRQLGVTDHNDALTKLIQAVEKTLSDPKATWLLDHDHKDSQCEFALGYIDASQQPRTAVIDRTFVDTSSGEDIRWIIDYKSGQPEPGESVESFITRQKAQYGNQLAHYASLYKQLESLPVKTGLYFPMCAIFTEL